jgi:hypothetical protein
MVLLDALRWPTGFSAKYIFYAFYPLHLLALYFIKVWFIQ